MSDGPRRDDQGASAPPAAGRAQGGRLRNTLVRNTLANGLNYAVIVASSVVLTPLVIRGFGTAVYGVWILITQLTTYAGLFDIGVQPAVLKRVAEARAEGHRESISDFLVSALFLHGATAGATIVLALVLSALLPVWFSLGGLDPTAVRLAALIAGLTTALNFPSGVFSGVMKGELRFDLVSWIAILGHGVRITALALALHFGTGIVGLSLAGLLSSTVVLGLGFFVVRRFWGQQFLRQGRPSWVHVRSIGHFGAFTLMSVGGAYLAYSTDAAIIGATLNVGDVAHFGLAMNVLVLLSGVISAFSGTLMPVAAQLETGGHREITQRTYLAGTRVCLTLVLPAALGFQLAGPELLSVWVGPDFGNAAGSVLRILAIAFIPVIVNGPGFHMGIGMGLNRPIALYSMGEGILHLAISYVLAKRVGVVGVAVGTLVPAFIAQGLLVPALVRSHLGISARRYLRQALLPAAWPLVPAVAVAFAAFRLVHPTATLTRIAWGAAAVACYLAIAGGAFFADRNRLGRSRS